MIRVFILIFFVTVILAVIVMIGIYLYNRDIKSAATATVTAPTATPGKPIDWFKWAKLVMGFAILLGITLAIYWNWETIAVKGNQYLKTSTVKAPTGIHADVTVYFDRVGDVIKQELDPDETVCLVADWDREGLAILVTPKGGGISFLYQRGDSKNEKFYFVYKNTGEVKKTVQFQLAER